MSRQASKNEMERLFVAIPLPAELGQQLGEVCRSAAAELQFAKWSHPADYHITLQFLGDTPKQKIPALVSALKDAAQGQSPFELSLEDCGIFGRPSAPRVLWAGVGGELDKLQVLQRTVTAATQPFGFTAEARPYTPHVTLARKYHGDGPFNAKFVEFSEVLALKGEHLSSIRHWTTSGFVLYATRMCAIPMYENVENMTFK